MIKCNLAVLLAERNMRISELSKRTGISRTTLTALAQNQSKGIQFETFDTLCSFLKITPNDLFIQETLEYDFNAIKIGLIDPKNSDVNVTIRAEVKYKSRVINETFVCNVTLYKHDFYDDYESLGITPIYGDELFWLINELPVSFKVSMEQELIDCIRAELIVRFDIDENIDAIIY